MPFNFPLYDFGMQNNMYQPDRKIFDMISSMMGNIPQRSNDQGILQRILAGVVGAGSGGGPSAVVGGQPIGFQFDANKGLLAQDKFMNPQYHTDLENYNNKLKVLSPMLENEQQQNVNKRILFDQNEDRKVRQAQVDRQIERDEQIKNKEDEQMRLAREKEERLKTMDDFKRNNPKMERFVTRDGTIVYADPSDPTNVVETPYKALDYNAFEKAAMNLRNDLEVLQARHKDTMSEIAARGAEARTTKSTPGSSTTTTDELPTQTRVRIVNRTKQFKAENPTLAKWVDDEGNIKEPTKPMLGGLMNSSGPTQVEYDKIKNYIYGDPIAPKRETVKVPNANSTTNIGKIRVRRKSDGQTGTIDAKDFDPVKYDKIGG